MLVTISRQLDFDSEVFGCSLPKPGRPANEDSMMFRWVAGKGGVCWLLAVADGVSTSPRGREAARFAVASFWASAGRIADSADPGEELRLTVLRIHGATRARLGGSGLASLVVAAVFPSQRSAVHASVGDSLVCIRERGTFQQVNVEDMVTTVRLLNSEPVLVDGSPLIDRAVSQGIGIEGVISPNMGRLNELDSGAVLCLASDGIAAARLGTFLGTVDGMPSLQAVQGFCLAELNEKRDDATLLVLRFSKTAEAETLERTLREYPEAAAGSRDLILAELEKARWLPSQTLVKALKSENDDLRAVRLVALLNRTFPSVTAEELIPLLEEAIIARRSRLAMALRPVIAARWRR